MTEPKKRKDPEPAGRVPFYAAGQTMGQFLESARLIGALCDNPGWKILMAYFQQRLIFELKNVAIAKDFKFWQGALAASSLLSETASQVLLQAKRDIASGEARGQEVPPSLETQTLERVISRWKNEQASSEQA